jgi:N-acetylglutamate synthase-like GNAT family acetyltransferase
MPTSTEGVFVISKYSDCCAQIAPTSMNLPRMHKISKRIHMEIKTAFLADHPEVIPTLAKWFRAQWPDYFAGQTLSDIEGDFYKDAQYDHIPVRLVAFVDGELAGTVVLRQQAAHALPEAHPGLGGLFVLEKFRIRGVGTELVQACMRVARDQGCEKVYATTVAARGILIRLGWKMVEEVVHDGEELTLYRYHLKDRDRS